MANLNQGQTCWNCGQKGLPAAASRWHCPDCDVSWFPIAVNQRKLSEVVIYYTEVVPVVDFTKHNAPSSPA